MTHDPLVVDRWGTPPSIAVSRRSIYENRLEVVRFRNKEEPELWGVVGELNTKMSAQSRTSTLRGQHSNFEFAYAEDEDNTGKWLIWARVKLDE
jgi:hypothetical protein